MSEEEDRGGCDCSAAMNGGTDHHPSCPMHVPKPVLASRGEIVADWNAMVATVAEFSKKYDLPTGELIFSPYVLDNLRDACKENLLDTFVFMNVRIRFGRFEQMDVLRQH